MGRSSTERRPGNNTHAYADGRDMNMENQEGELGGSRTMQPLHMWPKREVCSVDFLELTANRVYIGFGTHKVPNPSYSSQRLDEGRNASRSGSIPVSSDKKRDLYKNQPSWCELFLSTN